jgi:hypothetical protein
MVRIQAFAIFLACAIAPTALAKQSQTPPPIAAAVERSDVSPACERQCLNAIEAVTYASYVGERAGIAGDFEMPVRNVGKRGNLYFLNSETDYRDRNCLTVAIPAAIVEGMTKSKDLAVVEKYFVGRRLVAKGIARQVRIDFTDPAGNPTGKYYYQVHVRVSNRNQLAILS